MLALIQHYAKISRSLLRVPTYLLLCLYLLIGFLGGVYVHLGTTDSLQLIPTVLSFLGLVLVMAFWYMNGTALNDYADYEIDLINLKGDKDRPLVTGIASREELANLAVAYAICAIGLAAAVSWGHALLVTILFLLNHSYSIKPLQLSRRGGIAPLLLPLGYIALPFLLGWGLTGWDMTRTSWLLLAGLYLQFIGRIILKDYRDVKGDAAHGKRTFLLRHGNRTVCVVSASAIVASCVVLLASLPLGMLGVAVVFFTAYAVSMLYQLSQTITWPKQKPILAAFGRAMTGVAVALIIALLSYVWAFSTQEVQIITIVLIGVYLWSAQQAYQYNARRLSPKAAA